MKTKVSCLSPFRFVLPSDYERWLETLASEGWHPMKIGQFSSIIMRFRKGEPKKYRYVYDLNAFPKRDYYDTYKQFGWELVGQMASCFIWRKEYDGARPESFTDSESVTLRNRRVRNAVVFALTLFVIALAGLIVGIVISAVAADIGKSLELALSAVPIALLTIYLSWVTAKLGSSDDK